MVNICITIMLIEKKELIKYLVTSKKKGKKKGQQIDGKYKIDGSYKSSYISY